MDSILTEKDFREIYLLTENDSPLKADCGLLCNEACCKTDLSQGIYLLPGEHRMFTGKEPWLSWNRHDPKEYFFPPSWKNSVFFLNCNGNCDRKKRPMQCRTFPVTPHLEDDGRFLLVRETLDTVYSCPILKNDLPLEITWLENLYRAWCRLLSDPAIYDLVQLDSEERKRTGRKIRTAYERL